MFQAVALLAVLPFLGVLRNGFVSWDDPKVVLENPLLTLPWGAFLVACATARPLAAWQPLGWLLYRALYGAFGPSPLAYHAAALVLHGVSAALLCAWLAEIVRPKTAGARLACAAAALAWAWHPVQVESVAWASALSDLLCGVFVLGGLVLREKGRAKAGLLCFALAGLCRWKALAYPVLCLMRDAGKPKKDWPALAAIGAAILAATAWAKSGGGYAAVLKPHEAAAGVLWQWSKLLWPSRLAPGALFTPHENPLNLGLADSLLLLGALATAVVLVRRKSPALAWAAAAFTVLLLPTVAAGPPARLFLYDHHLYLALAAFAPALAAFLARSGVRVRVVSAAALVAAFAASAAQSAVWRGDEELWTATLRVFPRSMTAADHLIAFYQDRGRHAEALIAVDERLAVMPGYEFLLGVRGALLSQVAPDAKSRAALERRAAAVLFARGDAAGAAERLETALRFSPQDPDLMVDDAVAQDALGNKSEARALLSRAIRLDPRHARANAALAALDAER